LGERNHRFDRAIHKALGDDYKEIVLYLADEATFEKWKEAFGTPHYAVATEGYGLSSLIGVLADIHGDLQALDAVVSRKLSPKFSHKLATIGSLDLQV